MRFDSISLAGLGPFRERVDLDLASLPGVLTAVVGSNGAGKSTLLELLVGALYRTTPTRGSLGDLATSRSAFVEVAVVNGQRLRVRQTIDSVSRKGEALVLGDDGAPLVESGKVSGADAWIAAHLPRPEVVFASMFAAQQSGGFLEMSSGDRKKVLLRILGIEHYEQLAERARTHARETSERVRIVEARIADERARGGDPDALHERLSDALGAAMQADSAVTEARTALDEARREHARLEAEYAVELARRERIAELTTQHTAAMSRVFDLDTRLANNRKVLERSSEIAAAVERAAELERRRAVLDAQLSTLADRCNATLGAWQAVHRDAERTRRDERAAETQLRGVRERIVEIGEHRAIAATLDAARALVTRGGDAADAANAALEALRDATAKGAGGRIEGLRAGLTSIWNGLALDAVSHAQSTLALDDERASRLDSAPADLAAAKATLRAAEQSLANARAELVRVERAADRVAAAGDLTRELLEAEERLAAVGIERIAADRALEAATKENDELQASGDPLERERRAVLAELATIEPIAKLAAPLAQAETRLAEIEPQLASAQDEARRLRTEIAELDGRYAPGCQPTGPDERLLATVELRVRVAEEGAKRAAAEVALAEDRVRVAETSAARVAELETEQRAAELDLADWTRLADDLGAKGLQSYEVDAAGPELTTLANDLLHRAFGTRFTVRFDTTRPSQSRRGELRARLSADGKREIDCYDVGVIDTERGRDASAETLSGGERVIIGEAISLALTMVACRRSGVQAPTVVRDESGAALDPRNAVAYVAMLRRAAEIIGASRILIVSHSEQVQSLCDSRVLVADGRVSVLA